MSRVQRLKPEAFPGKNGLPDYAAFRVAQVENGDVCKSCGRYTTPMGTPANCVDCRCLIEDRGEVTHDCMIRCPACGDTWDQSTCDPLPSDGQTYCGECGHEFHVEAEYSVTYTSPAMLDSEASE